MATKYFNFTGKAHWAKLKVPDEAFGDVRWAITVELDEEGLKKFEESELRLKLKDIGEGRGVQFRRPTKKLIKGDMVEFESPKVTTQTGEEYEGLIGNGSQVSVNVVVYDSAMGKGHRLESVKIIDLVEYDPDARQEQVNNEAVNPKEDSSTEKAPW